jgi:hypothetical protein
MKHIAKTFPMLAVLLLFPMSAHAYLDPGAGSALIQGILGAVAAIGVALKLYWHRILKCLGLRKPKDDVGAKASQDEQETENRS